MARPQAPALNIWYAALAGLGQLAAAMATGRVKQKDLIAHRLYRWLNHWGMERCFAVTYDEASFSFVRRADEIKRYEKLDGRYVIRSNVSDEQQSGEQLRACYKDLKHVEQAFRTMKTTDIQTRPIRHFGETQVKGHLFACFPAYRVSLPTHKNS